MIALYVLLFFLAVHRVSRFIVADTFPPIEWLRGKITDGRPREHWLVYLLGNREQTGCPWCASIWVAGIGVIILSLTTSWLPWQGWIMLWLASSSVTGFLAEKES